MRMNDSADAGRVVADLQEARLDHVADHLGLGVAEELGVDVVTDGGDERQQRAGEIPGSASGKRDPPERCPRAA